MRARTGPTRIFGREKHTEASTHSCKDHSLRVGLLRPRTTPRQAKLQIFEEVSSLPIHTLKWEVWAVYLTPHKMFGDARWPYGEF